MIDLKIIQADNGFILVSGIINDDNTKEFQYVVVEDTDNEQECIASMLTKVAEHFGFVYDKFSPNNLNITFDKKGHKVD